MSDSITWVALDTSKKKHAVAVLGPGVEGMRESSVTNERRALARFARKLVREAPGEVRICYEAGPCGFAVKRELEAAASVICEVIAPSLIPIRPGERVKTDRRDARKLVGLFRAGELTEVHPPTAAQESVRDLVRCREDAKKSLLSERHRLAKFLLRRGRLYTDGKAWTLKHGRWLDTLEWEHEADTLTVESYKLGISQLEDRIKSLEEAIQSYSEQAPYRESVGWLRCFRGIDTITAMTLLTELHDISRFRSARELMSYLGLTCSEHSSGDRVRRGGIGKAGNSHGRRVLVEAAHCNRHSPKVGYLLKRRREGQPAWAIAHADRAMQRLSRRYRRLAARGKPHNKIVAALAREMAGFVWAVLKEGERRGGGQLLSATTEAA